MKQHLVTKTLYFDCEELGDSPYFRLNLVRSGSYYHRKASITIYYVIDDEGDLYDIGIEKFDEKLLKDFNGRTYESFSDLNYDLAQEIANYIWENEDD